MNVACYVVNADSSDAYKAYKVIHDNPTPIQQHFLDKSNHPLTIELYHLSESIIPFITCEAVFTKLKEKDTACLPLVLIDNIVVKEGALLSLKELEILLDIVVNYDDAIVTDTPDFSYSHLNDSLPKENFQITRGISDIIDIDDHQQLIRLHLNHPNQTTYTFPFHQLKEVTISNEHNNPNWQMAAIDVHDNKVHISDIDWEGIETTTITRLGVNFLLKRDNLTTFEIVLPLIDKDISADSPSYRENLALSIEITNILSTLISPIED